MAVSPKLKDAGWPGDAELVHRAALRDAEAIRHIIKSHNQRLYRLARAVMHSNADAEDVLQEAYLRTFANLDSFRGESSLSTWLSRITLNEALARLRKQKRLKRAAPVDGSVADAQIIPFPLNSSADDPERTMAQRQLLQLVEQATDDLPDGFRMVFVARVIEGLSVEETAALLGLQPATVKTRLHRARKLVKDRLEAQIGPVLIDAFPFAGKRCDRLTQTVLKKLKLEE
ncbi:MAG: RNA polymerase sigma factor [Rhizobiaceae bacterium]